MTLPPKPTTTHTHTKYMTDKEIDFITRFVIRFLKENKIITKYRHDFDNYPLFCSRIESFENPKIIRNFNEWLATYIKKSDAIHPFSLQNVFNRGIDKYQLRDKNFWNDLFWQY